MIEKPNPRFLIFRLSSIGDIVHALPAVAALGRTFPLGTIHWVVEKRYAQLLEGNPYVHRAIELDTLGWRRRLASADTMREILRSYAELKSFSYDAAIDIQGLLKTGLLAWVSRSEKRVGFSAKFLRESAAAMFYTDRVSPEGRKHIIEMNLALVESLGAGSGAWEFPLPANEQAGNAVRERLKELGTTDYIIVNSGGGWKGKRWSGENYAAAIRKLAPDLACDILLTGSPQERPVVEEIIALAQTPKAKWFPSTLVEFIALARGAKLLIGGDSGPLHLAAAVGTPLVAIFDLADPLNTPERNGPFNPADIVLGGRSAAGRDPYSKHLSYLEGVSPEAVAEAALRRLQRAHE